MWGLFGSERYGRVVGAERRELDRLLARDPLRLRRFVPRRVKQVLYDRRLTSARREATPEQAAITTADFHLARTGLERALDVIAVCRVAQG